MDRARSCTSCPSEPLSTREPKAPAITDFCDCRTHQRRSVARRRHKQLTSHRGKGSKAERHTTDPSPLPVFRSLDRNMPQSRALMRLHPPELPLFITLVRARNVDTQAKPLATIAA